MTSAAPRQIRLGAFLQSVGHHLAAWRHPDVDPRNAISLDHFKNLARIAERGKFDAIFFADGLGLPPAPAALLAKGAPIHYFDPLLLQAVLSTVTERIGLAATVSTSYLPPFHLARKFAALDHLSNGRAAWNLVTSGTDFEAANFGLPEQVGHHERYARAREYVDVVRKLWDSFEDDAFIFDQAAGKYFDPAKLHVADHKGEHYSVRGPLAVGRPPQGYPVLVQAGSSDDGQELAAATAEVVFTAQQTLADAQAFYKGLKERAARYGRAPGSILVFPGIQPIIGRTQQEAEDKLGQLQSLLDPVLSIGLLSAFLNRDLSTYPIDGPLPNLLSTEGWQSRQQLFVDLARRENLSIRQLALRIAGGRGHKTLIGTPQSIADTLEEWFTQGAADGFNILPPVFPFGLGEFTDLVIPELRRRGLFRTEYEGKTLRENLGLTRPLNSYTKNADGTVAA
ncbi:alkanesulfonate monooxygenase [Methylovirgula ligni]|uniref:Alkanesulfonate monooxygenase n=1 Tax=Methylovirgula ligni TaxID=569860 RepID=A0A3D9YU29_9HYPH|nr:LLM class flavin-dependent oxidoreductase [Methylovirgula ligni]REF86015.1 alkanesulfonate monooxygenase [Methylovirgula ligni]